MNLPYINNSIGINGYTDSTLARSESSDCVVRAIASASGMEYDKSHSFVSKVFGRKPKKGTFGFAMGMDRLSNENKRINRKKVTIIPKSNLKTNGGKSKMTVGTFIKEYNKGSYVLTVIGHAFTIKDGVVIGNYSDSTKKRKIVHGAWKIGTK